MNIVLVGAQGSGKGTQAEKLSQDFGICHVASGNLFRQAIEQGTELGMQAKAYIDRGELVPDDITVAMVLNAIVQPECAQGILLDGFPRTNAQAEALDAALQSVSRQVDLAVYLNVPHEDLFKRLAGRYICRLDQRHIYNMYTHPPKIPGVCDQDDSELYQRLDDAEDLVQKRLSIFLNETIQLLDYYRQQQKLVEINGNQRIDQVHKALLHVISQYLTPDRL